MTYRWEAWISLSSCRLPNYNEGSKPEPSRHTSDRDFTTLKSQPSLLSSLIRCLSAANTNAHRSIAGYHWHGRIGADQLTAGTEGARHRRSSLERQCWIHHPT